MSRKLRNSLYGLLFASIMCLAALSPTFAATLSKTKSASVNTSIGGGTINVTAQYYTTGNTRWNKNPTSYGTSSVGPIKSVSTSVTNVQTIGDTFKCTGNISITLTNYATGTGSAKFTFDRSGNSIY